MLLYSPALSPRLNYIAEFVGEELFGLAITITTSSQLFIEYSGPRINYSAGTLSRGEFILYPDGLLLEQGITPISPKVFEVSGYKAFFQAPGGDFAFDIFSAAFYLLSRYEEYFSYKPDRYGRYPHTASLAWKAGFLHLPLINIWLQDFKTALLKQFPGLNFVKKNFTFLPTYDIDIAYSHKHKGWARNAGGLMRAALKNNWKEFAERVMVMCSRRADPFDSYDWLDALHARYGLSPYYFFLVAAKRGQYDRNIAASSAAFAKLVKRHASRYTLGVHPSWQTGDDGRLLGEEIKTLKRLSGQQVLSSRQHYIRFTLPQTYRNLIDADIRKDFSMGYGGINGFRASIASAFNWYDLEKEETTGLRIYPFCFMDATAFYIQKLQPGQALEEMMRYCQVVQEVDGLMVTIWHNNFLGTDPQFAFWKEVYEDLISEMTRDVNA